MLFNLDFAKKYCFIMLFIFHLIIELYFLIAAVIGKMFNPPAKLVTPIGIPTREEKAEIETHQAATEA